MAIIPFRASTASAFSFSDEETFNEMQAESYKMVPIVVQNLPKPEVIK